MPEFELMTGFARAVADDATLAAGAGLLATLRGETFGIGASDGTRGADAAALVMLALFAVLFTLIIVVARGFARRAANPAPEQVLLDEVGRSPGRAAGETRQAAPDTASDPANGTESGKPWQKPDDWWRRMPQ